MKGQGHMGVTWGGRQRPPHHSTGATQRPQEAVDVEEPGVLLRPHTSASLPWGHTHPLLGRGAIAAGSARPFSFTGRGHLK